MHPKDADGMANSVGPDQSAITCMYCMPRPVFPIINSLTTKKQATKFSSANFQKMLSPSYIKNSKNTGQIV